MLILLLSHRSVLCSACFTVQGGPQKPRTFVTSVYDDAEWRSVNQFVQLLIRSKTGILNVAIFKS